MTTIYFTVEGSGYTALCEEALQVACDFFNARPGEVAIQIAARPIRNTSGRIFIWEADVEASLR